MGLIASAGRRLLESGAVVPLDPSLNVFSVCGGPPFNLRFVTLAGAKPSVLSVNGELVLLNFNTNPAGERAWANLEVDGGPVTILFVCMGAPDGYGCVLHYSVYS